MVEAILNKQSESENMIAAILTQSKTSLFNRDFPAGSVDRLNKLLQSKLPAYFQLRLWASIHVV